MTALHKRNVIKIQILKIFAIFQKVPLSEWQYFELTGRAVLLAHKSLVWLSKQSFNIEPCVQTKEKIYLFVVQLWENSWRIDELSEHQWDAAPHKNAEGLNQQIMSSCPASNSWIWDNLPAESLCSLPSDCFICIQLCLSPVKCLKRLIGIVHYQGYPTLVKTKYKRWKGEGKRKYFSVVPISSCVRAELTLPPLRISTVFPSLQRPWVSGLCPTWSNDSSHFTNCKCGFSGPFTDVISLYCTHWGTAVLCI